MSGKLQALETRLREKFGANISLSSAFGELTAELAPENLISVCTQLRDDPELRFEQLIDLCGVDYLTYGTDEWDTTQATASGFSRGVQRVPVTEDETVVQDRFAVVYHLLSVTHNHRLRLRTYLDSGMPVVASVVDIWNGANWYEREAFDLYGILFDGHPDLRRILTDYGFIGHPFRKDFPLIGHVEMRYDADKQRVIYQPVSIEPRTLVPRVLREDHRYLVDEAAREGQDA
jgi:NADH-quinone oxidoreductase subunit C